MQIHRGESLDGAASCYCSEKLIQHGDTTRGDDWYSGASETLRFEHLCRIVGDAGGFAINDFGGWYRGFVRFARQMPQAFFVSWGCRVSLDD